MKELTERQKLIYDFIQEYILFYGYSPTYRDIAKKFNFSSTFGARRHVEALIKKGYLTVENNASRTICLTEQDKQEQYSRDNSISIPVVGRVAAGYPILAEENIEDTLRIDGSLVNHKNNCFALRVWGDSMINAGILEGDFAIITPIKEANNGDIIVGLLGDEATLKRFRFEKDGYFLMPENENYAPIPINNRADFSIIGKVISIIRFYN